MTNVSQPTSTDLQTIRLSLFSSIALLISLLLSCSLAVATVKTVNQLLLLLPQSGDAEQIVPDLPEILIGLLALLIGSGIGGLVAALLQRRILQLSSSHLRHWTIVTIGTWCCAVIAMLIFGLPFALMLGQIVPPLAMNGVGILGGCVGGCIGWLQLRSHSLSSTSRYIWIALYAGVWGTGLLIVIEFIKV